jgi:UDP-N-acetyl-D-mannosaminuronic acid transferase (WecB/TagA/CpsF family)
MDDSTESKSYSLFGVRVDVASAHHAALAIVEGAVAHVGIRVVLADLWTFLLAQRDFLVWESLSGADLVLPAGDDAVIRRLARRRSVPIAEPDRLIQDLLTALDTGGHRVVLMAPDDELSAIGLLFHRLWPQLQMTDIGLTTSEISEQAGERLLREVNAVRPELLLVGGQSPWQERWTFEQRALLQAGAVVLLPSLQGALTAIGHRAGIKVVGPQWKRRRVALQRAFDATIAPAAQASARTLGSLLRVPRETLQQSPLAQWRFNPVNLRRLTSPHARSARGVRVAEWHDPDASSVQRLTASPLARLGPPRRIGGALPALPPPSGEMHLADQPTITLSLDALRAAIPREITGHIVDASSTHAPQPPLAHGISQELIMTGRIREPDAPVESAGESAVPRGTTPLARGDVPPAHPYDTPDALEVREALAPTTRLREPLAPTTKLRLPLAPTTLLRRRAGGHVPDADAVAEQPDGQPAPAPPDDAVVSSLDTTAPAAREDAAATNEHQAMPAPVVEELATAASLGGTSRRPLRRRRRMPRRKRAYYRERG